MKLPRELIPDLRCPLCHSKLHFPESSAQCAGLECKSTFPIVDGIPVLINEQKSVFLISQFEEGINQYHRTSSRAPSLFVRIFRIVIPKRVRPTLRSLSQRLLPSLSVNVGADANFRRFLNCLPDGRDRSLVLVVGGSQIGHGMRSLIDSSRLILVDSDVSFGPRTQLIADGHDLPFQDGIFDGVVIQAVLEHVVDPARCVSEIHRVLKNDGLVYAETPFMQQVHAGAHDFCRFTDLGHRRLFRHFTEIERAVVCGPGMALAWAFQYFLLSFARSKAIRSILQTFAQLVAFPLKYFDYCLVQKPGASDAASGFSFLGRKSDKILSDRELLREYRGLM